MMKRILLIAAIIFPGYSFGQYNVSLSAGLAGFGMEMMKEHQSDLQWQFPTNVKIVESFPEFWFYEVSLTREVAKRIKVGGVAGFTSTGGRMSYRDYSGMIECNQIITAWTIAAKGEALLNPNSKWPVSFSMKAGTYFGIYDLDVTVEINDEKSSDNITFQSINAFVEPGFMISRNIVGPLAATVSAGYNINVWKGKQKLSSNTELYLLNTSDEKITLDWSGFRLAAGLSVAFHGAKE